MKVGSIKTGTPVPVQGRIRNLNVYEAGPGGLEATYRHEGAIPGEHHTLLYVNGTFSAMDTDQVSGVSGLSEGSQNLHIIPQLSRDRIVPIRFDDEFGGRILLSWQPVYGDSIAGYRIYHDSAVIATVTERALQQVHLASPDSGTGTGRISCPETPLPAPVNAALILTVTAPGQAEWSIGPESGSFDFSAGTTAILAYGIAILFEDMPDAYHVGDLWNLHAGIASRWISDDLLPGVYQFEVTAFDHAGTESPPATTQNYEIQPLPAPVVPVETWLDANTLNITWDTPPGAAGVALYHNYLPQEGVFSEYVSTVRATSATITFEQPGEFMYYVRPYMASGIELPDYTLHNVDVPHNFGSLGTPEALAATASGVLGWRAAWEYEVQEDDALSEFTIHRVPHGNAFDYDTDRAGIIPVTPMPGSGYVLEFDFEMTTETIPAGPIDIQVVARGAGGIERRSDIVTVTTYPAATIPAPGFIIGGAV